jgi:hypothetical protein
MLIVRFITMASEIVFSGGERVGVPTMDARELLLSLNRAKVQQHGIETEAGLLPPGWVNVPVAGGTIYVNPERVAYVRDALVPVTI